MDRHDIRCPAHHRQEYFIPATHPFLPWITAAPAPPSRSPQQWAARSLLPEGALARASRTVKGNFWIRGVFSSGGSRDRWAPTLGFGSGSEVLAAAQRSWLSGTLGAPAHGPVASHAHSHGGHLSRLLLSSFQRGVASPRALNPETVSVSLTLHGLLWFLVRASASKEQSLERGNPGQLV